MKAIKNLLVVLGLGLLSATAWAQCAPGGQFIEQQGQGVTYGICTYPSGNYYTHGANETPVPTGSGSGGSRGSSAPSKPRVLDSKYGAVALDMKTGGFDSAYGEVSEAVAKSKALQKCASKNCKIIGYYRNTCTALARGQISKTRGVTPIQYGITKAIAESKALARCEAIGAKDCKIIMPAECSLPS
jgi:hypothetical protein